jgi:hypothetical protein
MAIGDYLSYLNPANYNVFGVENPTYTGLLSPEQTTGLKNQSNIAGLLGAAAALATGMGRQGARRSAAQNIIGALGAGYGAAGQAYQGGIQQIDNAQKLAQIRLQMQQNAATQQAINSVLQDPRFANDPTMKAALLADPQGFLKMYAENAPIQAAISGVSTAPRSVQPVMAPAPAAVPAPVAVPAQREYSDAEKAALADLDARIAADPLYKNRQAVTPSVVPTQVIPTTSAFPELTKTASSRLAELEQRRSQLLDINSRLSGVPGDKAAKQRDANNKDIENIRKETESLSTSGYDFARLEKSVPAQLKPYVIELKDLAGTGGLSANELAQRIQAIQSATLELQKGQKYDGIVGNYAYTMFGTNDQTKLTADQNRNVLAYANAPTQADQTKIAIDAQKLKFETGGAPSLPTSREQMIRSDVPVVAPPVVPNVAVAPPAVVQPVTAAQPAQAPRVVPEIQRTSEVAPEIKPTTMSVQVPKGTIPLINQPDNKVTPKRKQELLAAQPATIALVNYTASQLVDARDAALALLNNPAELKAISGLTGPAVAKIPGTDAYTGAAKLENLQTRSFVSEIQKMRAASPTGGAVGSVTEKEMAALSNIQASLKAGLKEDVLRKQLKQYIDSANFALKTIPIEYARTYGYQGEFEDILSRNVVQQQPSGLPSGVTVKRK